MQSADVLQIISRMLRGAFSTGLLRGADFSGVILLSEADLRGADFIGAVMHAWHTRETIHCIAGWAVRLAGERGEQLEREHGPQIAGLFLLGLEAHRHYFDDKENWLRSCL